jgi:hypothetical protein
MFHRLNDKGDNSLVDVSLGLIKTLAKNCLMHELLEPFCIL